MDLPSFRVPCEIDEVFYISNFISTEEEEYLLRKISETSSVKWKTLPNRRLQVWGGELTPSNALIPQELPSFITNYPDIITRLRATGVFSSSKHGRPNHVIVNEYHPGQGIMPHEDGPTYHPVVATLSLGSHAVFNYHRYLPEQTLLGAAEPSGSLPGGAIDPTPILSLLLEPRSLVITAKALYTHHLHAIEPLTHDVLAPAEQEHSETCPIECPYSSRPGCCENNKQGIRVFNWKTITGEQVRRIAREGGSLERSTRVSLTCRDVERVVGGKALGKAFITH